MRDRLRDRWRRPEDTGHGRTATAVERPGSSVESAGSLAPPQQQVLTLQRTAGNRATAAHLRSRRDGLDLSTAARTVQATASTELPHRRRIEGLFGGEDLAGVRAHVGGEAAAAARSLGAAAFTTGESIAFQRSPDLRTAAHEAAHVVQQRSGIRLRAGIDGGPSDPCERRAEHVAGLVARGRSAAHVVRTTSGTPDVGAGSARQPGLVAQRRVEGAEGVPLGSVDIEPTPSGQGQGQAESSVYELGTAGKRPYDVFQDYVSKVNTALENMRESLLGGVENFCTSMSFASSTEAQPDVMGAILKEVGSQVLSQTVDALPHPAGVAASSIKGVVTAATDELGRAAKAAAEAEIAAWVNNLRTTANAEFNAAKANLQMEARSGMNAHFDQLAGEYDQDGNVVTGPKAEYLYELEGLGTKTVDPSGLPSLIDYQENITVAWIDKVGAAPRARGVIAIELTAEQRDEGSYEYGFKSAKLLTPHHSGNAADLLNKVMKEEGKKVYELGLPVQVGLDIEYGSGLSSGASRTFWLEIRGPSDYDRAHSIDFVTRAWQALPWRFVFRDVTLEGG